VGHDSNRAYQTWHDRLHHQSEKKQLRERFLDAWHRLLSMKGEQLMIRSVLCSVGALVIFAGLVAADQKTGIHAVFVKADLTKHTITFMTKATSGKNVEMTLPLAKNAKVLGEDNKPEAFLRFANNMQKEKGKSILIFEDQARKQIVEVRDLPSRTAAR
jgi:hypothetical protein